MKISVIISYYKALDNLKLILLALQNQSVKDFEVVISEDDNNPETPLYINENSNKYNFRILHTYQVIDDGFRKNSMLNKSIIASNGDFLIFIDGDCIPDKNFIKNYIKFYQPNTLMKGRRVMLGEKISKEIKETNSLKKLSFKGILFSDSTKKKEAIYSPKRPITFSKKVKGLLGCNWGIDKQSLINVNGFDEDYVKPSVGEDTDVNWRLQKNGVKSIWVKNIAVVYHIYHDHKYSKEDNDFNVALMEKKKRDGFYFCKNGIKK
ncbi:glycosyltransferase [Wenyingzhuangia sp. IMCC45574]